jgi:endonuclease/exonuclease/phosphatase family metal-dependent hydrolase
MTGIRLRVLTYNIRSGTDFLWRSRFAAQTSVVCDAAPDVVLLQEVGHRGQAEHVARAAGLCHMAFGPTRCTPAGEFGNAILSRWPLFDIDNRQVPRGRIAGQPRAALAATLLCGEQRVRLIGSHFGLLPGEPELSARTVLAIAAASRDPIIVGGDFNRPLAGAGCHRLLRRSLIDCASAGGRLPRASFPAPRPVLRLDYLYVRDLEVRDVAVLPSLASDHRPLLAELDTAGCRSAIAR